MITPFQRSVYEICKQVPAGKVTTYKAVGEALGIKGYRAVGMALHRNPFAPDVPCHRVVTSDGGIGGFAFGVEKKIEMLRKEGVIVRGGLVVGFEEKLYLFKSR